RDPGPRRGGLLARRVAGRPARGGAAMTRGVAPAGSDTAADRSRRPEDGATAPSSGGALTRERWRPVTRAVTYISRRTGITAALLLGVTVMTFLIVQAVPGDAASANLSETALNDPEVVAAYRARWGLDQPLPVQYWVYLTNVL